jgi:molecular chaperone GrpE
MTATKHSEAPNTPPQPVQGENMDLNSDENIKGVSHLNEPVSQESELEQLRAELAEMKDKYLRNVAEFDNFRKRTAKERLEWSQSAGKDVIRALLEVLDDCDRAEGQFTRTEDIKQIREGVMLVFHKLRTVLQARGLKKMDSLGMDFNPDQHEAVTEIPVEPNDQKGKIVDELEKGYYLNDKILRFAKVVVGK